MKLVKDLTRQELEAVVTGIQKVLYLDNDDGRDFWNPEKPCASDALMNEAVTLLDRASLRPEKPLWLPIEPKPAPSDPTILYPGRKIFSFLGDTVVIPEFPVRNKLGRKMKCPKQVRHKVLLVDERPERERGYDKFNKNGQLLLCYTLPGQEIVDLWQKINLKCGYYLAITIPRQGGRMLSLRSNDFSVCMLIAHEPETP